MRLRPSASSGLVAALLGYLLLGLLLFSAVLAAPTSSTMCSCGDPAYTLWFQGFAAHALAGLDPPFATSLLWHPTGINVLDGATQLGIGLPLAPVTWLIGVTGSLNLALLLAPTLSALGAFVLLSRFVEHRAAAFVGGLLVGFSPFLVMNDAQAHLVVSMAALPPLIVACLDELIRTQRHRPIQTGVVLGLLVAWQFFVSAELLLITAAACVVGLAAVGIRSLAVGWSRDRARHAWAGLLVGGAVGIALLAYPAWFAVAGPAHVSGAFYPGSSVERVGTDLRHLLLPAGPSDALHALAQRFGAYQGPVVPAEFIGLGALAVAVVGLVLRRRDPLAWLLGGIGSLFLVLSLGAGTSWRPWQLLAGLPLAENLIPARLLVVVLVCVAGLVAFAVDGLATTGARRSPAAAAVLGVLAAAVAVAPIVADLAPALPLTAEPVAVPRWFRSPHQDAVVLPIPVAFSAVQSAMAWQADAGYRFSMAGGDGPGSDLSFAGGQREAERALLAVSGSFPPQRLSRRSPAALRRALEAWQVGAVVLPIERGLPAYDRPIDPIGAAALVTAATGALPVREQGSLVWRRRGTAATRGYLRCTVPDMRTAEAAAACVLRARR